MAEVILFAGLVAVLLQLGAMFLGDMMRHVSRLAQSWGNSERGSLEWGGGGRCGDNGQSFGAGWAEAGPSGMGILYSTNILWTVMVV